MQNLSKELLLLWKTARCALGEVTWGLRIRLCADLAYILLLRQD
jgi:hypothetical protein